MIETPIWVWLLISGLTGAMTALGIAGEIEVRRIRRIYEEWTLKCNNDLKRRMK